MSTWQFFSHFFSKNNQSDDQDSGSTSASEQEAGNEYKRPESITEAYSNARYRGKIVIESPDGLFSTTKEDRAVKKLRQLHKQFDSADITTTVIPDGMLVPTPARLQKS